MYSPAAAMDAKTATMSKKRTSSFIILKQEFSITRSLIKLCTNIFEDDEVALAFLTSCNNADLDDSGRM
ncbi:unnamed protein product [Callosobruchus maculatus]|uniref:Uncharacterized protein n=1 Tax=Callosobruchus maculatus TaxID=64391 RepID=A0A653CJY5_CALMS|nr:unnamed protein product [Callosobruchus maculatus]